MKRAAPATQPLGPQHLVGAGILVVGVVGLAKLFIAIGHAKASQSGGTQRARVDNARGQYGSQP
jgi:hypothetical protein